MFNFLRVHCTSDWLAAVTAILALVLGVLSSGLRAEEGPIAFGRDIQPILAGHCFHCHGPDEATREAGLRLDTEDGARATLAAGGGDAKLLERVKSHDPDVVMPPPEMKKPLTPAQIELLSRWVDAGSPWGAHWAFEPLVMPAIPVVSARRPESLRNPIDHFVQARLAVRGVSPAPVADRETLIRRVTLDLIGLPPTPAEVDAFTSDRAPNAWDRVVDRLLNSPAYGERMAWDWLDAARYADSNGYQGDRERTMWPWRDWVVDAFNRNLPYDDFTVWQLAGDLLPDATFEQQLATGFCRNHMINGEGGRIAEENRVEYVMDMTETAGTVWLGLTMNCCRCHDHKFDPLTQQDYFRLFAFFNQTAVDGSGGDPQTPPVLETPTDVQRQSENDQESLNDLRASVPQVMVMQDLPTPRKTWVLARGVYNKPGDEVTANTPETLPQLPTGETINRLALARWIVSAENPLTARVTVNRFWQQFFGIGLVKTTEDFGIQGEIPIQQDLLDWLAADFRQHRWDVKRLVRQIVTSHTYRQASRITNSQSSDPNVAGQNSNVAGQNSDVAGQTSDVAGQNSGLSFEDDPENRYLSRGPRFRLPAWMIRDQALAASGLIVRGVGGVPVKGYQPAGVWEEATFGGKKYVQDQGDALFRRSLYTFWRRIIAPTMFFDNASRQTCTVKMYRTNTPLHSLVTLNDVTFVEAARTLAEHVLMADNLKDGDRIDEVFRRLLARPAADSEKKILIAAIARSRKEYQALPDAAGQLLAIGESKRNEQLDASEHAAWTSLTLAVMNLDETLTKE